MRLESYVKTRSSYSSIGVKFLNIMAGSWAPYIHVILSDIVSITWYITQPLVRLTTAHYQSTVSMISFAEVFTVQWSDTIPSQNVWFQVGITSHDILFQHSPLVQRTPEFIKSVIMADKKSKSLHITLSVLKNNFGKDVTTQALINCGASINCLDWGFIKQYKLPCYRLPEPICAKNVNGSYNDAGIIKFITTLFIWCPTPNLFGVEHGQNREK